MMTFGRCHLLATVAATAAMTMVVHAHGQELLGARTDVAGARTQPDLATEGLHLGSWTVAPQIQTRTGYDSNLYGTETNPTSSAFAVLTPSVRIRNDWGQEALTLTGNANLTRFVDHSTQNSDEYALRAGGQFALGDVAVQLGTAFSRTVERRGTNGTPLTFGPPSLYRNMSQSIGLVRESGPLSLAMGASHQTIRYSDLVAPHGRIITQDFRDSEGWGVNARASFVPSDSAGVSLYVSYDRAKIPKPFNFTNISTGFGGSLAIDAGMFRLSAKGGRINRRFGNPAFRDFTGWTYDASLDWYPTPLITVGLQTSRGLENSGSPAVGSIVARSYSGTIDYELLRNFLLHGRFSWRRERFPEIGQSARNRGGEIKGEFSFNRFVAIGAYGRHECRNSSVTSTARRFCVDLVGLSLTLRR